MYRRTGGALPLDDLLNYGRYGFWRASRTHDPALGSLLGYAAVRVRGAMFDAMRSVAPVPRHAYQAGTRLLPLDAARSQAADTDIEAMVAQQQMLDLTRAALTDLPYRERELVRRHYFHGERFDHVARELGLSKSWASRLHHRAIKRLQRSLRSVAA